MMAENRFEQCLTHVLAQEGGYADNPADPGGATNMGITRKTLARWRQVSPWWALPKSEVKALGREEAARIYRASYWYACAGDRLPVGVDLALFDFAVNSGPDRAIRTLQRGLAVKVDGIVGPLTLAAASKSVPAHTVDDLCDRRLTFLRALSTFSVFGNGWERRVAAIRAAALAMAGTDQSLTQRSISMEKLSGYKTYIVAAFMMLAGVAQILGVNLPTLDGGSAGHLMFEALAIVFLRKGLKVDAAKS